MKLHDLRPAPGGAVKDRKGLVVDMRQVKVRQQDVDIRDKTPDRVVSKTGI